MAIVPKPTRCGSLRTKMSFTLDIIEELTSHEPEKSCCRKAFLFGLFFGAEKLFKTEVKAEFKTEQSAVLASSILQKQFSVEPNFEPIVRAGRKMFWVSATSKSLASMPSTTNSLIVTSKKCNPCPFSLCYLCLS